MCAKLVWPEMSRVPELCRADGIYVTVTVTPAMDQSRSLRPSRPSYSLRVRIEFVL